MSLSNSSFMLFSKTIIILSPRIKIVVNLFLTCSTFLNLSKQCFNLNKVCNKKEILPRMKTMILMLLVRVWTCKDLSNFVRRTQMINKMVGLNQLQFLIRKFNLKQQSIQRKLKDNKQNLSEVTSYSVIRQRNNL